MHDTHDVLAVQPQTVVSNERDRVLIQATRDSCGSVAAARGASIHAAGQRMTTDSRGRATLFVRLPTGRYPVSLFVHRHLVARTHFDAIPYVAH